MRYAPWLLHKMYAALLHPLTLLFQKSLNIQYIMQDWKDAYITPLHKGAIEMAHSAD